MPALRRSASKPSVAPASGAAWKFALVVAVVFSASGCGSILDIKVYDDDDAQSSTIPPDSTASDQSNETIPPDSTASDQSSETSSRVDAAADVAAQVDATIEQPDVGTSDSATVADAKRDASDDVHASDTMAGDASDASSDMDACRDLCTAGMVRCSADNRSTEACEVGADGCTSWTTATTCGPHQACTAAAKCACNVDPVCSGLGSVCVSSSAYAVCAQDLQGCFYQASNPPCINQACVAGTCTGMCTPGTTSQCATCQKCDSTGTCSVVSDGTPCESGGQVCTGGSCRCPSGMHLCSASCVPDDANACGPSCTKCTAGQGCFGETCGCTTSAGCPAGQACNPSTHVCSTTCDGIALKCNGGCCNNGTCDPGLGGPSGQPCGSGGLQCAQLCVLGACDHFTTWNGGSCECNQDSVCAGNPTGPRCVGNAAAGAGICGCLSDADCGSNKCNLVGANGFPGGYCQ